MACSPPNAHTLALCMRAVRRRIPMHHSAGTMAAMLIYPHIDPVALQIGPWPFIGTA